MYAYERLRDIITAEVWNEEDAKMCMEDYPNWNEITNETLPPLFHLANVFPFKEARTAFFYDLDPDAVFVNAAFNRYHIYTPFHAAIKFDNVELVDFYARRNPRVLDMARNQNVADYAQEMNASSVCVYLAQKRPKLFDELNFRQILSLYNALTHHRLRAFDAIFAWTKSRLHLPYYDGILDEEWHVQRNESCDVRNDGKPRCAELAAALIESRPHWSNIGQLCMPAFERAFDIQFNRNPDVLKKLLLTMIINGQQAVGTSLHSMKEKIVLVLEKTGKEYLREHDAKGNTFLHHCFTKNYSHEMNEIISLVAEIDPGAFFVRNNQGDLPITALFSIRIKQYETQIIRAVEQQPHAIFETKWTKRKKLRPTVVSILVQYARTREEFLFLYERCTTKARHIVLIECPMLLEMRTSKGILVKDRIVTDKYARTLFLIMTKTLQYIDLDAQTSYGMSIRTMLTRERTPMIRDDEVHEILSSAKHLSPTPTSMLFFLFIAEEFTERPRRRY